MGSLSYIVEALVTFSTNDLSRKESNLTKPEKNLVTEYLLTVNNKCIRAGPDGRCVIVFIVDLE